jgi:hypothetical protein
LLPEDAAEFDRQWQDIMGSDYQRRVDLLIVTWAG